MLISALKTLKSKIDQLKGQENRDEGFGTWYGVFVPNVTMMFGVILFLRIAMVTGYVGLPMMLLIGTISLIFMILTSISISSIVTNLQVKGGGVYYIASRTLGIEIGGAIGIAIYLAQVCSIALCVTGFAYSIQEIFPFIKAELIELVTLLLLTPLSVYSTNWTLRLQVGIFFVLLIALISVICGSMPSEVQLSSLAYYPNSLSFWQAFAIIYPALTGIEVGMAMSGQLRSPGWSISVGTVSSLIFSYLTYMGLAIFVATKIPLEALVSDPFILVKYAKYGGLVYVGIWCATLSSALGSILAAPKMLQTLAEDGIAPQIFSQTFGHESEPRYAIAFTSFLALLCALFTKIDQIIPILSMIALITYGVLNFLAFFGEWVKPASWRPAIRSNLLIPLGGMFMAVYFMFSISPLWSWVGIALVIVFHFLLQRQGLRVDFQDIRESVVFFLSRLLINKLEQPTQHALNWHPQLIVFVMSPQNNLKMIHLAHSLTRKNGILSYATVMTHETAGGDIDRFESLKQTLRSYYQKLGISCFVEVAAWDSFESGFESFVKSYGFGGIQPNTAVMGWPVRDEEFDRLADLAIYAKDAKKNFFLFKEGEGSNIKQYTRRLSGKKTIHLWWDGLDRSNFELMLSYILNLKSSLVWGKAQLTIKSVAVDNLAKKHVQDYLLDYCLKNRIKAKVDIHLLSDFAYYYKTISHASREASLVFVGLSAAEDKVLYSDYLRAVDKDLTDLGDVVFVTCYDSVDHSAIYSYEHEQGA